MKRMQVQFTEQQAEWLAEQSRRRGVSISSLVRDAVSESNDRDDAAWQRALGCLGMGRSGNPELSAQHDAEWADAIEDGQKPI